MSGRLPPQVHRAYSLFYVIGTIGAMRVPVVGWGPLKSTEQIAPLLVFLAFQILEYCEVQRRKRGLSFLQLTLLRIKVTLPILIVAASGAAYLQYTMGYFGPPSARVRGLFVKHTRTGNPLVDSVAEHQPANAQAYQQVRGHCSLSFTAAASAPLPCTVPHQRLRLLIASDCF